MKSVFNLLRYVLLISGFLLILPHLLLRYGVTDFPFISALNFSAGWIVGLMLCLLGFGWPSARKRLGGGDGSGIGWTSGDGDGGGCGGGGGD